MFNSFLAISGMLISTMTSEHFVVHGDGNNATLSALVLAEAESARDMMIANGIQLPQLPIDIYLMPNQASIEAFTVGDATQPFIALNLTPPSSDTVVPLDSHYRRGVFVHELAHLSHLARVHHNPLWASFQRWSDIALVFNSADHALWLSEGYATWIESILLENGRLENDYVQHQVLLSARTGQLLSYAELMADDTEWSYYIGVSFVEWLVQHYGQDFIHAIFRQLYSGESSNFDQAVEKRTGLTLKVLYGQFSIDKITESLRLHENTTRYSNYRLFEEAPKALALSPLGTKVALAFSEKIEVFELDSFLNEATSTQEGAVSSVPIAVYALNQKYDVLDLSWIDDQTVVFNRLSYRENQAFQSQLQQWNIASDKAVRLDSAVEQFRRFTKNPLKDQWVFDVVADSSSSLQVVAGSSIDSLSEQEVLVDFPRFSTNGQLMLYLQHYHSKGWNLVVTDSDARTVWQSEAASFLSFPSWSPDGETLSYLLATDRRLKVELVNIAKNEFREIPLDFIKVESATLISNDALLVSGDDSVGRSGVFLVDLQAVKPIVMEVVSVDVELSKVTSEDIIVSQSPEPLIRSQQVGYAPHNRPASLTVSGVASPIEGYQSYIGYRTGDFYRQRDWTLQFGFSDKASLPDALYAHWKRTGSLFNLSVMGNYLSDAFGREYSTNLSFQLGHTYQFFSPSLQILIKNDYTQPALKLGVENTLGVDFGSATLTTDTSFMFGRGHTEEFFSHVTSETSLVNRDLYVRLIGQYLSLTDKAAWSVGATGSSIRPLGSELYWWSEPTLPAHSRMLKQGYSYQLAFGWQDLEFAYRRSFVDQQKLADLICAQSSPPSQPVGPMLAASFSDQSFQFGVCVDPTTLNEKDSKLAGWWFGTAYSW